MGGDLERTAELTKHRSGLLESRRCSGDEPEEASYPGARQRLRGSSEMKHSARAEEGAATAVEALGSMKAALQSCPRHARRKGGSRAAGWSLQLLQRLR